MAFNEEKTRVVIQKLIKDKIEPLINSDKIVNTICNKINDPFDFSFGLDHVISSSYTRSFSSSLGTNIQNSTVEIAKIHGWNILNDGLNDGNILIKGKYSDETRKVINETMSYINNSDSNNKINKQTLDTYKRKIMDSVLNTVGEERSVNSDLILYKMINGVKEIKIIELKSGGDLDKGKAKSQREEILEIYAVLISKYKSELLKGTVNIDLFFATIYNKNSIFSGEEDWKSASVKKNFISEELLIGKDFWNTICNDDDAFSQIVALFFDYSYIVEDAIKTLKERVKPVMMERIEKIENELLKKKYIEIMKKY